MNNFATTIKELRIKRDWSQRQLALSSGVSNTEINRLEKGERSKPSLTIISKLASAFGISVDELLSLSGITETKESYKAPKKPKELIQLIEQENYTLNGQIATQEDRDKLSKIIEALYWDAKEKNKRK